MSIPLLTLLGFALWTLVILFATVGFYRWRLILTGRAPINTFRADAPAGPDWYRRAMRAHVNCIENLPVFGAIVGTLSFAGVEARGLDVLSIGVLGARVCQTLTHVSFVETPRAVSFRFAFYFTQIIGMFWMATFAVRAL